MAVERDPGFTEALQRKLEIPMIVLSLAVIPALLVEHAAPTPGLATAASTINLCVWLAFVAEYAVMMWLVHDRWKYTRGHWLDVLIIVLSLPVFLPEAMTGLRALKALRVFRLLRTARVMRAGRVARLLAFAGRGLEGLNRVLRRNSLHYVLALTLLLTLAAGTLLYLVEGGSSARSLGEGIWWAVTTVTALGNGDVAPTTPVGRGVGVAVMLLGIGFVAILTANMAAWFVEKDQTGARERLVGEIVALREEVATLRVLLTGQRAARPEAGCEAGSGSQANG